MKISYITMGTNGLTSRAFSRCCYAARFIFASSTAAIADKEYTASIATTANSPVTLNKCEPWARDASWKPGLYTHASVPNLFFDLGIAFANTSDKPVTALRVELISYDAFNTAIRTSEFDTQENASADKMSVAPGASFDFLGPRSWHNRNGAPNRDHVSCAITAVKFADGTVWTAGVSPPSQQITTPVQTSPTPASGSTAPGVSPSPGPQKRAYLLQDSAKPRI